MSYVGGPESTVLAPEISDVDLPKVRMLSRKLLALWECEGQGIFLQSRLNTAAFDAVELLLRIYVSKKDPHKKSP